MNDCWASNQASATWAGVAPVLALSGRHREHGVCTTDRARGGLGEAEVLDLALAHQLGDGARDILDRDRRVDPVLVEQVDRIDSQAPERRVGNPSDVLRSRVRAAVRAVDEVEAELRRHDDLIA